MPLSYYPRPGEILVCDYGQHAIPPEMTKTRPVVVVGPRHRRRADLVGIVPLSTTVPRTIEDYHCQITLTLPLPPPFDSPTMWAKCDMYQSVALQRLDRFKQPRNRYGGARKWTTGQVTAQQLEALKTAVLRGLGLG